MEISGNHGIVKINACTFANSPCMFFLQSELEIEPRYPLFGGWKTTFIIGYGLPLQDFLFESPNGQRYLNFSFGCPLIETVVDELTIKVSNHFKFLSSMFHAFLSHATSQVLCMNPCIISDS